MLFIENQLKEYVMSEINSIKQIFIEAQEKIKNSSFTTGFEDLDIFCKYLNAGSILTIGGRPAMGKTSLACSLANHFLDNNKKVLFFSLQLSKEKLAQRLVAEKINTPILPLLENKINEAELDIALNSYADKSIEIIDKIDLKIEEFEDRVKTMKPDIVFVDYIQLLEMPKAPNLTEATNLAIKEVKRIAVENNIIVVLLSQLSRAVETRCDKIPLLSDLRNGSLLEEISDIILFIYREDYYDFDIEQPSNLIIVSKNIIGPTGTINLDFKNGFFRNKTLNNSF